MAWRPPRAATLSACSSIKRWMTGTSINTVAARVRRTRETLKNVLETADQARAGLHDS